MYIKCGTVTGGQIILAAQKAAEKAGVEWNKIDVTYPGAKVQEFTIGTQDIAVGPGNSILDRIDPEKTYEGISVRERNKGVSVAYANIKAFGDLVGECLTEVRAIDAELGQVKTEPPPKDGKRGEP